MSELAEWLEGVRADLDEMESQDFGYPLGVNEIRAAEPLDAQAVPSQLKELYLLFDGLSLPDVYVGYFIDAAARVQSAQQRGEPMWLERDPMVPIHVFGSDGGGGRFAISGRDGVVYYLPSSGAVVQGRYVEDAGARVRQVAANVRDFLERLRADVHAFVHGAAGHRYLIA